MASLAGQTKNREKKTRKKQTGSGNYDTETEDEELTEDNDLDTEGFTELHKENGVLHEQDDITAEETKQAKHPERQEETKQEKLWGERAPFIIMLAVGTIEDLPEAFKRIEEEIKIRSARRSVGVPEVVLIQNDGKQASKSEEASNVVVPVQSEEEQASKIVGRELGKEISESSEKVQDLLLGSSTKEEQRHLADAVIEFTSTIYSDVIAGGMSDTEALTQAFENALNVLISVPVAEQNTTQLIVTFVKLAVFSMTMIGLGKQCLENSSMTRIAWVVLTVGSVMFKIANKHGLYEWIKDNGGFSGLCVRICDCIRQIRSGNTVTDDNTVTDSNTVAIPWPSNNTIILFGTLTVFIASCTYFVYKNR